MLTHVIRRRVAIAVEPMRRCAYIAFNIINLQEYIEARLMHGVLAFKLHRSPRMWKAQTKQQGQAIAASELELLIGSSWGADLIFTRYDVASAEHSGKTAADHLRNQRGNKMSSASG